MSERGEIPETMILAAALKPAESWQHTAHAFQYEYTGDKSAVGADLESERNLHP